MKNVIIMGATGMVGALALQYCLAREDVAKVTVIVRRSTGLKHPKLTEIIHSDFTDYSSIEYAFEGIDAGIYCIGVYTGQVSDDEFSCITVDYTKAFADMLKKHSPDASLSFLSGGGADRSEKSHMIFAREKGKAENYLVAMNFEKLYIFRPGYIYPSKPRKEPNFGYVLLRKIYPLIKHSKSLSVTSERLAAVMASTALEHRGKTVFENRDIVVYAL